MYAVKFQSKSLVKFSINKVNGSHLTSRSIKSKSFRTRLQRRQRRRHQVCCFYAQNILPSSV